MNIVSDNLDQIINAPDGIKRLRELILQLAVQGKLVPQRPEEGSADELLKQIKEAKERIPTFSTRRTSKSSASATHDLVAPNSWTFCRFDEMAAIQGGIAKGRKLQKQETVELPYLRVANVQRGFLNLSVMKTIRIPVVELEKYTLAEDDLLITEGGDWDKVGRTAVWKNEIPICLHQNHVFRARLPREVLEINWVVMFLNSIAGRTYFAGASKQTTNLASINMTQLRACPIPLPPLLEQKRIVAKVDELMAWCDELDALKEKRTALRTAALKASRNQLTTRFAGDTETPSSNRSVPPCLCGEKIMPLITSPADVKQLRDAILQLAVQGRLVEQRDSDGTAADLLQQIEAAKAADLERRKAKGERIRKTKPLPPITSEEIPFQIPDNWKWVRLGTLSTNLNYGYTASANHQQRNVRFVRITDIQNDSVNWDSVPGCEIDQSKIEQFKLIAGDLLIARTGGTIGKTFLVYEVPYTAVYASYLIRVTPIEVSPEYLKAFAGSDLYWGQLYEKSMGTGQPNVNATSLSQLKLPLPPLAEQQRIVAKVDELMGWCDELERLLQTESETAARFASAIAKAQTKHPASLSPHRR